MKTIQKVALATDLTEASAKARAFAASLHAQLGGQLNVVHVAKDAAFSVPAPSPEEEAQAEAEVKQKLAKLKEEFGGSCETLLLKGDPAKEIIGHVNSDQPDLLVVGAHSYNWIDRVLSRGVHNALLKEVDCPVVVVPEGKPVL